MTHSHPNLTADASSLSVPTDENGGLALWFKRCPACQALAFPPTLPGCAACGHSLDAVEPHAEGGPFFLREFVTLHVPLVDGIKTPLIVGEVEVAPGLIRQAVIEVAAEAELALGQSMRPVLSGEADGSSRRCVFVPVAQERS
ncbi:hypothetical protein [Hydrogenophaga sp.]|jgi:uncharacterized OB-fold protein|uniref:hypothetical protein n=1 Tax=Hydrogenophaga sp. TaxID=1904254 RepID=UPI00391CBAFB